MELAMIGLGKMGANMTSRLLRDGHRIVVYDLNPAAIQKAETEGAIGAHSFATLVQQLATPRAVWLMVPSGDPTEQTMLSVAKHLAPDDIIMDGGNSNYKDSIRRAALLKAKGIHFVDVGTILSSE